MSWVYLDDHFPEHPKVVAAGDAAAWLFVAGLCYCRRNETEGAIPKAMVAKLVSTKTPALAQRLVAVGLWLDVDDKFVIHDYSDWNRPAEARSEAGRKAAAARWGAKRNANASKSHMPNDALTPSPNPSGFRSSPPPSSSIGTSAVETTIESALSMFADRTVATANGDVHNPSAYRRKVLTNARAELAPKARDWLTRYDVSASQLADALANGSPPPGWNNYRRSA